MTLEDDESLSRQLREDHQLGASPSTKLMKRLINEGCVSVQGWTHCRASDRVEGGERVRLDLDRVLKFSQGRRDITLNQTIQPSKRDRRTAFWRDVWIRSREPDIEPASIVHLDDALIVMNKCPSIPTAPTLDPRRESLYHQALKAIESHLSLQTALSDVPYLRVIHRLDRDTSGLVVMARTPESAHILNERFRKREIDKRYIVRCLRPMEGQLNRYLKTSFSHHEPLKYEVYMAEHPPLKKDKRSQLNATRWVVVQQGGVYSRTDFSVISRRADELCLKARLYTGRTHQIRVHLASLNAPIIGDELYHERSSEPNDRLFLHACYLQFQHPVTNQEVCFEAPPNERFYK